MRFLQVRLYAWPQAADNILAMNLRRLLPIVLASAAFGQTAPTPGMVTPQYNAGRPHPTYAGPYGVPSVGEITKVLERVREYVDTSTRLRVVDRKTGAEITDFSKPNPAATVERVPFNIVSYEW